MVHASPGRPRAPAALRGNRILKFTCARTTDLQSGAPYRRLGLTRAYSMAGPPRRALFCACLALRSARTSRRRATSGWSCTHATGQRWGERGTRQGMKQRCAEGGERAGPHTAARQERGAEYEGGGAQGARWGSTASAVAPAPVRQQQPVGPNSDASDRAIAATAGLGRSGRPHAPPGTSCAPSACSTRNR